MTVPVNKPAPSLAPHRTRPARRADNSLRMSLVRAVAPNFIEKWRAGSSCPGAISVSLPFSLHQGRQPAFIAPKLFVHRPVHFSLSLLFSLHQGKTFGFVSRNREQ
jgi:hypothetical protein